MNRKNFIFRATLSAFGLTLFGSNCSPAELEAKAKDKAQNLEAEPENCETSNDILGPFYRADAPLRADLTYEGLAGTPILLTGTVYKSDCVSPLKNALVEIWHCNAAGEYDNESDEFRHRATWLTDEKGTYNFKTILPGKYLNGELYRPSHIHYRVTEKNSRELVSQIYFQGDPHITKDPWASKKKAEARILDIHPVGTDGTLSIKFDIYLAKK
jgi:protocatechuate 3,4-dioxygenase beta subunit